MPIGEKAAIVPPSEPFEVKAQRLADASLRLHAQYQGKIEVALKCPVRDLDDFAYLYTPGVAAPCRAIQADAARINDLTNKSRRVRRDRHTPNFGRSADHASVNARRLDGAMQELNRSG